MVANVARIAKGIGRLVLDPQFTEVATKTLKASKSTQGFTGFGKQVKNAFVEAEKQTKGTPFYKNLWKAIKDFPKNIGNTWKNTTGAWNKTKGIAGEFGKILPAIFGALTVGFELRNIIPAFQDKGIVGGLLETVKSIGKVACSFAGFAIGAALITWPFPFVGGLIGAIATDMVTSAIVGHGYADQKAEIENQKKAEEQQYNDTLKEMQKYQQGNPFASTNQLAYSGQNNYANQGFVMPKMTMTPQQTMQLGQMLYSNGMTTSPMDQDFMAMTSGMNRLNYIG